MQCRSQSHIRVPQERRSTSINRRKVLTGLIGLSHPSRLMAFANSPIKFGLTPVFLNDDLALLTKLQSYLERRCECSVELVQRRTYEEITTLLLSGELSAAWICGFPFVQHRLELSLLAVPEWRKKPLYQSYVIVPKGRKVSRFDELKGDIHAFSDPNSNSGYLVTAALIAEQHSQPEAFFRKIIFTYGHRNVVRAVGSGLAQSGSVDGYVWEVMSNIEPDLTSKTEVLRKSEELGFPPVACLSSNRLSNSVIRLHDALLGLREDAEGRDVLDLLELDDFSDQPVELYDSISQKMALIGSMSP